MAVDCLHEPPVIAFAKTFGASIGILGAALAGLLNNALRWLVWVIGEWRREYELIKGLNAEIGSNSASEASWSDPAGGRKLIDDLKADLGPDKPWAPYVAVVDANIVFDSLKGAISRLPADVIEKVVKYYNLAVGLTKQLADLRADAYVTLSHSRQVMVIEGIFALGAEAAAPAATAALARRLTALQILYGLGVAGLAISILIVVPALIRAADFLVTWTLIPAAEWASACDLAPKQANQRC